MKTKCHVCKAPLFKEFSSYRYKESGLDNVYLENIPIYKCIACGTVFPSIFRLPRLNELIAEALLEKPALLNGKEIKFLRKSLHFSSKDFSDLLGVGKTTLSKWENGRQQHSEANDKHIRSQYMLHKGFSPSKALKIIHHLLKSNLKKSVNDFVITAAKIKDDYIVTWKEIGGTIAICLSEVLLYSHIYPRASTNPRWCILNSSYTESVFPESVIPFIWGKKYNPQAGSFCFV
jgi:putative zinc finger/helix-turn-helix YgiT family protein